METKVGQGRGGYRPGAGPKVGGKRITAAEVLRSIEAKLPPGTKYQDVLAEVFDVLLKDFRNGQKNMKYFLQFLETLNKRVLEGEMITVQEEPKLSEEEVNDRIKELSEKYQESLK